MELFWILSIFEAEQSATEIVQDYSNCSNPFLSAWFELTLNLQLKASHSFGKYILVVFFLKGTDGFQKQSILTG